MPSLALFVNDDLAVKRVTLPAGTLPGSVSIGGIYSGSRAQVTLALEDDGVLITGVQTSDSVAYSLRKSLGNQYYMYLFGDNPTPVRVSGICVPNQSCTPSAPNSIDALVAFYTAFKASGRSKSDGDFPQVTVSVAGRVITGLLLAMSVNQVDVNQRVASFSFDIMGLKDVQTARPMIADGDLSRGLTSRELVF